MIQGLSGLSQYIPTGGTSKLFTQVDNYVKTNTDEDGKVTDPNIYDNAIYMLQSSAQSDDPRVENKILTLNNQKKALSGKIDAAENNIRDFSRTVKEEELNLIKKNYSNPVNLITSLAGSSFVALQSFYDDYYADMENAIGKGKKMPESYELVKSYLEEKNVLLTNLANSYVSPVSDMVGPQEPEAYGLFFKTNPETGAIMDVEVDYSTSVDRHPGYMKSKSTYGRIPIYLNTWGMAGEKRSKLGGRIFTEVEETGEAGMYKILEPEKMAGDTGLIERSWYKLASLWDEEKTREEILRTVSSEIPIKDIPMDYESIPMDSVVKNMGTGGKWNYFYYDRDGNLLKSKDENTMRSFLKSNNRDENEINNRYYFGTTDFVNNHYKKDSKVIDENYFNAQPSVGSLPITTPSIAETPISAETPPTISAKGKPSTQIEPRELLGDVYLPQETKIKSEKIFKSLFTKG